MGGDLEKKGGGDGSGCQPGCAPWRAGGGGERGCFGGIRAGSEHERTETIRGGGNIKTLP